MWNEYAHLKATEIERTLASRRARPEQGAAGPVDDAAPRRRLLGPLARATGSRVRRAGEALERWATPQPSCRSA